MSTRYGMSENGSKFSYGSINGLNQGDKTNARSIKYNQSRQMLSTRESTRENVWMSRRSVPWGSGGKQPDLRMVPTLLQEDIRLFTTADPGQVGKFYMRESAFYNRRQRPEYALSVSPELYQQLLTEVNDSHTLPFGLYFCCHGGDGAHSGVAHEDFVDIQVAWMLVAIMMTTFVVLSMSYISVEVGNN